MGVDECVTMGLHGCKVTGNMFSVPNVLGAAPARCSSHPPLPTPDLLAVSVVGPFPERHIVVITQ